MEEKKFDLNSIFREGAALILALVMVSGCVSCSFSKKPDKDDKREEETEETKDPRIPDYQPSGDPDYVTKTYEWYSDDYEHKFTISLDIDRNMYEYFCSVKRTYSIFGKHMARYINEENNEALMQDIADQIKAQCVDFGYDEDQAMLEAINFVQSIPYEYDIDSKGVEEYSKFPIEMLYEENGDCEDSSMLLAGILKAMDYDVIFLWYMSGHMAVGVKVDGYDEGKYFEYEGDKYFYIETTASGWEIGEEPFETDVKYIISADIE